MSSPVRNAHQEHHNYFDRALDFNLIMTPETKTIINPIALRTLQLIPNFEIYSLSLDDDHSDIRITTPENGFFCVNGEICFFTEDDEKGYANPDNDNLLQ